MFVTLGEFNKVFGFCFIYELPLLIGNPQQLKEPRFSAADLLDTSIERSMINMMFKDPNKEIWSIENIKKYNGWAEEFLEDYLGDDDDIEIYISPRNVKKVMTKFHLSRNRVADEVITQAFYYNDSVRGLFKDLCEHLNLRDKEDVDQYHVMDALLKLNDKRFYQAISEIIIACIKE